MDKVGTKALLPPWRRPIFSLLSHDRVWKPKVTTSPGSTSQNVVRFGACDEFVRTVVAFLNCRFESK